MKILSSIKTLELTWNVESKKKYDERTEFMPIYQDFPKNKDNSKNEATMLGRNTVYATTCVYAGEQNLEFTETQSN